MCYNFLEINAKYFYTLINIRGRLMSRNKSEIDIFFILDETVNIFTIRKYFYVAIRYFSSLTRERNGYYIQDRH